ARPTNAQIALIILCILVCGTGYGLVLKGTQSLLHSNTRETAARWAHDLMADPDRTKRLMEGGRIDSDDILHYTIMASAGRTFKVRVLDARGRAYLEVARGDAPKVGSLYQADSNLLEPLRSGEVLAFFGDGTDKPNRPPHYAAAYVPQFENGELARIVEVYLDVTDIVAKHRTLLAQVAAVFAVLILLEVIHAMFTGRLLRRQAESNQKIADLAERDVLTGAINRGHFISMVQACLDASRAKNDAVALHFIDIDRFKAVNDALGHETGDLLLREVATRLSRCAGPDDVLARLGGDEFAILQTGVRSLDDAEQRGNEILAQLRAITAVGSTPVSVTASIGTATSTATNHPGVLQRLSEVALFKAKQTGRNQQIIFSPGMEEDVNQQNKLRLQIKHAVANEEFEVHYQPLHTAKSSAVTSFEALLRLPNNKGGYISPAIFIPVAEDMGLTPEIGAWVLHKACMAASAWPQSISVSVNLSPQQFRTNVGEAVSSALAASGLAPHRLELEITENLFIENPEDVERQLHAIKALGVSVVMDDFGTGYSSLQHLWKFPFDKLKVDRSCFQSLGVSNGVPETLKAIRAMSKAMRLRVTAEGIETEMQRDFARAAGYDELQGFLYSRPLPFAETLSYITGTAPTGEASGLAAQPPAEDDNVNKAA
ncbi:MAG: EAL domain-containing protein, partial [Pseudomonadota bacterium]